jgi:rhamnosyltransferase
VDNGSGPGSAGVLRAAAAGPAVTLLAHGENTGIARALNAGVQAAMTAGYAWALLLDQDTEVDGDIVARLLASGASHPAAARLAVVGSKFRDTHGGAAEPTRLNARGELWQEVESVITSGSLLSLTNYPAIGPFRDDFFIDYVDTEYCFRARAAGYRVIETVHPLMSHTIGAPTAHRSFGRTKWTTNHSAERRYYIARNNTVLLREYGTSKSKAWRYRSFIRCLRLCKRIAFFETDKAQKIRAVIQGWWDGVRGRMGPRGS